MEKTAKRQNKQSENVDAVLCKTH